MVLEELPTKKLLAGGGFVGVAGLIYYLNQSNETDAQPSGQSSATNWAQGSSGPISAGAIQGSQGGGAEGLYQNRLENEQADEDAQSSLEQTVANLRETVESLQNSQSGNQNESGSDDSTTPTPENREPGTVWNGNIFVEANTDEGHLLVRNPNQAKTFRDVITSRGMERVNSHFGTSIQATTPQESNDNDDSNESGGSSNPPGTVEDGSIWVEADTSSGKLLIHQMSQAESFRSTITPRGWERVQNHFGSGSDEYVGVENPPGTVEDGSIWVEADTSSGKLLIHQMSQAESFRSTITPRGWERIQNHFGSGSDEYVGDDNSGSSNDSSGSNESGGSNGSSEPESIWLPADTSSGKILIHQMSQAEAFKQTLTDAGYQKAKSHFN